MYPGVSSRSRGYLIALAILASTLVGCLTTLTAPQQNEASRTADGGRARLVTSDLLAAGESVRESLAAAIQSQKTAHEVILRLDPDVVGTAASTLNGHPVVVALTRRTIPGLPARAAGLGLAQLVVGDVRAAGYYCGTSAGPSTQCSSGTLGAIVTDGVRNYWLSNWHVFVRTTGTVGTSILSPGRADAGCGYPPVVGNVSRFVPVRFDGSTNTVDCAIARIAPGITVSAIEAAGPNSFKPAAQTCLASIGLAVKKVGRTTGYTTGKVTAVNASLTVNYLGIGGAKFSGLVIFSHMSESGDSGSLIVSSAANLPVALLFADSPTTTVGCPINAVYQAIGAHIAN